MDYSALWSSVSLYWDPSSLVVYQKVINLLILFDLNNQSPKDVKYSIIYKKTGKIKKTANMCIKLGNSLGGPASQIGKYCSRYHHDYHNLLLCYFLMRSQVSVSNPLFFNLLCLLLIADSNKTPNNTSSSAKHNTNNCVWVFRAGLFL